MPDQFGRMTEEERMALAMSRGPKSPGDMAFQAASSGMTNAMMSPTAAGTGFVPNELRQQANQSFGGEENAIKRQMQYANMLRGGEAPRGRTVDAGMGMEQYIAPTWADHVAHAGKQALGGYMSHKANQRDQALDESRLAKARAQQEIGDIEKQADRDVAESRFSRTLSQSEGQNAQKQANWEAEMKDKVQARADAAAATKAAAELKANERQAKVNAAVLSEAGDEASSMAADRRKRADKVLENSRERFDEAADKGEDLTEAQRTARYRAKTMDLAIQDMQEILDEGYNPGGVGAVVDRLTNKSDLTRFVTSHEGEVFQSAASTAKDAALRTATGAAAPETEQKEYMQMLIPIPGESKETVMYKMSKLKEFRDILTELGGDGDEAELANYEAAVLKMRESDAVKNIPDGGGEKGRAGQGARKRKKDEEDEFNSLWGSSG